MSMKNIDDTDATPYHQVRVTLVWLLCVPALFTCGKALAYPDGVAGYSNETGSTCDTCHSGGSYNYSAQLSVRSPAVAYGSSYVIENGDTAVIDFLLDNAYTASRAPYAGFNASSPEGTLSNSSTKVRNIQGARTEVTHDGDNDSTQSARPTSTNSSYLTSSYGDVTWTFTWRDSGPASDAGATIYACGNPVNGNYDGDTANGVGEDGDGPVQCDTVYIRTNDIPVVNDALGSSTSYYEDSQGENYSVKIETGNNVFISDADNADNVSSIRRAQVQIYQGYVSGQDIMTYVPGDSITGSQSVNTYTLSYNNGFSVTTIDAFEAALARVQYSNNSENPVQGERRFRYRVQDTYYRWSAWKQYNSVFVYGVNDAPGLGNSVNTVSNYTENGPAVSIDSFITITDPDSTSMNYAEVEIINDQPGDQLSCLSCATYGLTVSYANGLMTISGVNTGANYETVLESVRFSNSLDNPSTLTRSIRIMVRDTANASSADDTTSLTVTAVNDAPSLGNSVNTVSTFTEGGAAAPIDTTITISDPDSTSMNLATVEIVNDQPGDLLSCLSCASFGLTASYANGLMTISGTTTRANYETVLESVRFSNNLQNPSGVQRNIRVQVRDSSNAYSAYDYTDLNVNPVNDPPVVNGFSGATAYTENGVVTVDGGISISDQENNNLNNATLTITNYVNVEDSLNCATGGGISCNWNSTTGVLSLNGNASIASYISKLQSVTYSNSSDNPTTTPRTVQLVVTDEAGGNATSAPVSKTINITTVNDAPVVSGFSGATTYTEGSVVTVDNSIVITDAENNNLNSATLTITNYVSGEDSLSCATGGGISCTWDSINGVLSLSGNASISSYDSKLQSVTYSNSSANPDTTPRVVQLVITDTGGGNATSAPVSKSINITSVNTPPVVNGFSGATAYTENGVVTVDGGISISDQENNNLNNATLTITNYVNVEDSLNCATGGGISCNWNSTTGVLSLNGNASIASYISKLQSVTYSNSSDNPTTTPRTVQLVVTDEAGGNATSAPVSKTINITAVNDAPTAADNTLSTNEDTVLVINAADFGFSDVDGGSLQSVSITTAPDRGTLRLSGAPLASGASVGIADINAGNLSYLPLANENGVAYTSFSFRVSDGVDLSNLPANTMTIDVTPQNDAPVLNINAGLTLLENTSQVITAAELQASDVEDGAGALTFTLTSLPASGTLSNNGVVLAVNDSFTQQDINNGLISYNAAGATSTTFGFDVSDSNGAGPAGNVFSITVSANAPPVIATGGALAYTENDAATVIDAGISITDAEGDAIQSATVQITGNYAAGEDVLVCPTSGPPAITCTPAVGALNFSGVAPLSAYQNVLRGVSYSNSSDAPSTEPRSVVFTVTDDQGNTSAGATATITVTAVNDAPTAANNTLATNEDSNLTISVADLGYNDVDGDSLLSVTVVSAPDQGSLSVTGSGVLGNGAVVAAADINAGNLVYTPPANANGNAYTSFSFRVSDGAVLSALPASVITIDVTPQNDAPVLVNNNTLVVSELNTATITAASLSFSDVDDGAAAITYTVTTPPQYGNLSSNSFTQADINNGNVQYTHTVGGQAADSFVFDVDDAAGDGPVGLSFDISITQNQPPVITAGAVLNFTEDDPATVIDSTVSISDAENDNMNAASVQITSSFANGEDLLACPASLADGISCDDTVPGLVSFSSGAGSHPIADYEAALRGVTYRNNSQAPSTATRTVSYSVADSLGNASNVATTSINISAQNDVPTAADNTLVADEDVARVISVADFGFSDVDGDSLQSVTVVSAPGQGSLSVTGSGVLGNGAVVAAADINAGNLVYTPPANANGNAYTSFSFRVSDGAVLSALPASIITIDVTPQNDAPVLVNNTGLISQINGPAVVLTPAQLQATDVDDTDASITYTVTTLPTLGSLSATSFTQQDIANGAVSYTPGAADGVTSFVFDVTDSAGAGPTGNSFAITIQPNVPPVVTAGATLAYTENDTATVIDSGITVSDADGDNLVAATVVISGGLQAGDDSLSFIDQNGISGSYNAANGTLSLTGNASVAAYQAALREVRFSNSSDDPSTTPRTVSFSVTDSFGNTSSAAQSSITIAATNDAPTAASGSISAQEDQPRALLAADFNFSDVDSADSLASVRIVSLPAAGSLLLGGTPVAANQVINAVDLNGNLTFTGASNAYGNGYASFDFTVNDGTVDSVASYTLSIDVTPVDDAPAAASNTLATAEDTPLPLPAAAFNFDDVGDGDSLSAVQIVSLPSQGALTLNGAPVAPAQEIAVADLAGNLVFTPAADGNGSPYASFGFRVKDASLLSAATYVMTIDVSPVNDAPVITTTTAPDATEDQPYSFAVVATDVDNDGASLSWSLTAAPAGMTISPTGIVNWTPPQNYVADIGANASFTVNVADPSADSDSQLFNITVGTPDGDGDGVADYADNCPADANADQADLDGDNIGDVCDDDIDGDGMDNTFENTYGLDPLDPSDASADNDNDGLSNLDEFLQGKDPTVDDAGPVISLPADIVTDATGYLTDVDLGVATAFDLKDGAALAVASPLPPYPAGRNIVEWTARDAEGNVTIATQTVDIRPLVNMQPDQIIGEGNRATVRLLLSGEAPAYPVTIAYTLTGTASADDYSNFASNVQPPDASVGAGLITLNSGAEVSFDIDVLADGLPEGDEVLQLNLTSVQNAALGSRDSYRLTITEANVAPQIRSMQARQANGASLYLYQDDGLITVSAAASDANGDNLSYLWTGDTAVLQLVADTTASQLVFDPAMLTAGRAYTLDLELSDDAASPLTTRSTISFYLAAGALTSQIGVDSDGDGLTDDVEGVADSDGDGIPDYLDTNGLPELAPNQTAAADQALYIQTDAGLMIRPGPIAIAAGRQGLQIQHDDYAAYGVSADIEDSYRHVAGDFNFEITGLGPTQATANVVLPVQSALPSNAVYRKFWPDTGWREFVIDENNRVASAPGLPDACPAPGSELYTDGLQPFHFCIQLTIEDGGPNDLDGARNGRIVDPGGPAVPPLPVADNSGETAATDANASNVSYGGAMSLFSLLGLCWLVWLRCGGIRLMRRYTKP